MNTPAEFDEIRPLNPEEIPAACDELLADPTFRAVMAKVSPDTPLDALAAVMRSCRTNLEFQLRLVEPLIGQLVAGRTTSFTLDGDAIADKAAPHTFVSNHRDIIMDPAFLSVLLVKNGFPDSVEIAIGDNLLIMPWIKTLVRLCRAFIVQRSLSMRQMLMSSMRLGRYINFAITEKRTNVWIAQREGRAKDSNDRTQESVLKMMTMGSKAEPVEALRALHIVPTALCYEYDPCDYLKAQEFQLKRDNPDHKKSQQDDLDNMATGIYGFKGNVRFVLAPCIDTWLDSVASLPKTEIYGAVAAHIDREIHSHYALYACNYIAADRLEGGTRFASHYTVADVEHFDGYIEGQLAKVSIPNPDIAFMRQCMMKMYGNPALNAQQAKEEGSACD